MDMNYFSKYFSPSQLNPKSAFLEVIIYSLIKKY